MKLTSDPKVKALELGPEDAQKSIQQFEKELIGAGAKAGDVQKLRAALAAPAFKDPDTYMSVVIGSVVLNKKPDGRYEITGAASPQRSLISRFTDKVTFSGIGNGFKNIFSNPHPTSRLSMAQNSGVYVVDDPKVDISLGGPGGVTAGTFAGVFRKESMNQSRQGFAISVANEATHRLMNSKTTFIEGVPHRNIYYFPFLPNTSTPQAIVEELSRKLPPDFCRGVDLRSRGQMHEIISDCVSPIHTCQMLKG